MGRVGRALGTAGIEIGAFRGERPARVRIGIAMSRRRQVT